MSNLTYSTNFSVNFNKNWLSTPVAAKQAIHQELNDIRTMLVSDTPAQFFDFTHKDFNQTIQALLHIYDDKLNKPLPSTNSDKQKSALNGSLPILSDKELQELEERLYKRLSSQLDDFLSDQMGEISENLKVWLKDAIQSEITAHTIPQTHL